MNDNERKYEKVDAILRRSIISMLVTAFITMGVRAVAEDTSPLYLFLIALIFLLFSLTCGVASILQIYTIRIMLGYKNRKSYEATEIIGSFLLAVVMGVGSVLCLLMFASRLFAR